MGCSLPDGKVINRSDGQCNGREHRRHRKKVQNLDVSFLAADYSLKYCTFQYYRLFLLTGASNARRCNMCTPRELQRKISWSRKSVGSAIFFQYLSQLM